MAKKEKRDSKLGWKIGSTIIVVVLGLLIGLIIWFFYVGSPKEIISVADRFKLGPEWKLTRNHVEPPRSFCVDVACPSVSRDWESTESLDKKSLESLLQQAEWKLKLEEDCFKITEDRPSSWCDIEERVGDYLITVSVSNKRSQEEKSKVHLIVRR